MNKVKGLLLIDKWGRKIVDGLDCDGKLELDKAVVHIRYDIPNGEKHIIIPTRNVARIEWFENL